MPNAVHTGLRPITRLAIILLILAPLALAVPVFMEPEPIDSGGNAAIDFAAAPVSAPAPLTARESGSLLTVQDIRPITGFAINAHHIDDVDLYLKTVDRIADLGANALIVLTPMIQNKVNSSTMTLVPSKCATDSQLIDIIARARQRGLHTTLLPIVLIENPGEKDWRGVIQPPDWDEWWKGYDSFTDRFVNIAVQAEVDLLVIGSELNSTESQMNRWERVAQRVRETFSGQIAYSANWDRYEKIGIWKLVDVMCVSSYFELERDNPDATEAQLVKAWGKERKALVDFAKKCEKPLMLSEVGYPSLPWASAHPWNYVATEGTKADHAAQAKCWRAFFNAWSNTFTDRDQPAAGFFGYFWSPYYHGETWDTGYGIEGKPSMQVVKAGFAQIRAAAKLPAQAIDDK